MKEQKNNSSFGLKDKKPERTCIACRKKLCKNELIRIVKTPDGSIVVDKSGCADGRGTYVCKNAECIKKIRKNKLLNRAFKCEVENSVYDALEEAFVGKQEQN